MQLRGRRGSGGDLFVGANDFNEGRGVRGKTEKPPVEFWPIDKVIPYENNVKIHDESQVAKIAQSIDELGWDQPIVVDASGVIIKGHGRRLAAISLGLTRVPVWKRDDLTPEQVRAARLADNRVAISDIDVNLLQKELADLEFNLEGIFDRKELEFMAADLGEMNDDVFVEDIDLAVADHEASEKEALKTTGDKEVRIEKALGFKTVLGKDEKYIVRFMAQLEADSGKQGGDAFVSFVRDLMEQEP